MRARVLVWAAVGFTLAARVPGGHTPSETTPDRVPRLIEQLGDDSFAKREAASRELEDHGEPALGPLRRAAASHRDPEVRRRAERIIEEINARAAQKELAKYAGSWKDPDGTWMTITGERWSSGTPTFGPVAGRMWISEMREKLVLVDFAVEEGPTKGQLCKGILRLDGDSLHYCGTYAGHYPTEFKTAGNYYSCVFKREKR